MTITFPKLISGPRFNLRFLRKADAATIAGYLNNKMVARYTLIPYPYKEEDFHTFLKTTTQRRVKKVDIVYAIADKETNSVKGAIGLHRIDQINKRAELGYWLARPFWGQGLMTEATELILTFGFKILRLNRIDAPVFHPNTASMKVLEKCGFVFEAVFRKSFFRYGRWMDEHWFSILKSEYQMLQRGYSKRPCIPNNDLPRCECCEIGICSEIKPIDNI